MAGRIPCQKRGSLSIHARFTHIPGTMPGQSNLLHDTERSTPFIAKLLSLCLHLHMVACIPCHGSIVATEIHVMMRSLLALSFLLIRSSSL